MVLLQLLMITNTDQGGHSEIPYRPNEVEGECLLK